MQFHINSQILKIDVDKRIETVAHLASALNLGQDVEIHHHMSKAHAGERITSPHLIPELWECEKEFYALLDSRHVVTAVLEGIGISKRFRKSIRDKSRVLFTGTGKPFTDKELRELEKVLSRALNVSKDKIRKLIMRAALVGKLTGVYRVGKKIEVDISKLPATIRAAVNQGLFTAQEVRSLQFAQELAAVNVTAVQDRTKTDIMRMVLEAQKNRTHPRALAQKMYHEIASDDEGTLSRDWERVAITEMNRTASDGFIGSKPDGGYVVGNAHHDACTYCKSMIEGRVYRVNHNGVPDYDNLKTNSKEYRKLAKQWDQEIWVGKTNYGRAFSKRKRTDEGLVRRKDHELAKPVIPLHPSCRCRWTPFLPDMAYIQTDRRGKRTVKYVLTEADERKRVKWVTQNQDLFQGEFEEQKWIPET